MQVQDVERETQSSEVAAIFRRVLVPVDFKMVSHRAVYVALEFRRLFGARVCVFNLTRMDENDQFLAGTGSPTGASDLVEEGHSALWRFVDNIAPRQADQVEYDVQVADDYVGGIRDKMKTWEPTLLVLSHEHHASLLRTHSERIVRSLDVPVLLLQSAHDSPQ
jgi:nucleotide-binding universal stress UspA family protein